MQPQSTPDALLESFHAAVAALPTQTPKTKEVLSESATVPVVDDSPTACLARFHECAHAATSL